MVTRLKWYGRRLGAMSAGEVVERSRRALAHATDGVLYDVARQRWRGRWEPAAEDILATRPVREPVGFMLGERGARLRTDFTGEADALAARADRALEHRVRFFGYPEANLTDVPVDTDPFTGRQWPDRRAKSIDYRWSDIGDPKWMLELHRCQDVSALAAAWLATDDERYGRAAAERLTSWIRAHPPGRGIAWSSAFETAMRAISFGLTVDALRGAAFFSDDDLDLALTSLWQHGRWIRRDPSTGSSANNHRIGELVGLVAIGVVAPELREGGEWLRLGLEQLARETGLQIRPDGTNVEQAFAYHVFVVDLLLLACALLDAVGRPVPEEVTAAVVRSGHALWAQLGEHESPPTYGDTDDARAFVLDGTDLRDPRGVAAGIAARFGLPEARRAASALDAPAWWLFGLDGVERYNHVAPAAPPGSVTLPDGGLTILRHGGRRATVDHGPHGYTTIAAHGHADALRLDVSLDAHELVVDPGVGSYFARPLLREAFRGTSCHATVSVDDADSSIAGGPFLWTRHAQAQVLMVDLARGIVVAEHDGYERLQDPVTHRRAVVALEDGSVLVVDALLAAGRHSYSQRWPLHPSLGLAACSAERVVAVAEETGVGLVLRFPPDESRSVASARGVAEPPVGWWSERLESVSPSWLVSVDAEASGPVEIVALVTPFEEKLPGEVELDASTTSAGTRIELGGARRRRTIEVDLRSTPVRVET